MSRALVARVERLEATRNAPDSIVRNAVDRPALETREQWLTLKLAELRGEQIEGGPVNAQGETFGQWTARRNAELGKSMEARP